MKPSSIWRRNDDESLDIFGNKKRGGCGEPVHTRKKINVSQSQNLCTRIANRAVLEPSVFSGMAPHLRASLDHGHIVSSPPHALLAEKQTEPVSDAANKLFREQLDQQIAERCQLKFLQKMRAMEEEKWLEQKVEKERQELESQLKASLDKEPDFGFLRNSNFRTSFAHVPAVPAVAATPSTRSMHDIGESEPVPLLIAASKPVSAVSVPSSSLSSFPSPSKLTLTPQHLSKLQIQLDEEKLAWKQKLSEQELEIKRLKLQMLEQQSDQKTTLQYLLKIQTDFSHQMFSANHANNINLRRPLSGFAAAVTNHEHKSDYTPRQQQQQPLQQQQLQHMDVSHSQSVSISPAAPSEPYRHVQFAAGAKPTMRLVSQSHDFHPQSHSQLQPPFVPQAQPHAIQTTYETPVVQKQQKTFVSVTPTPAKVPAIPTADIHYMDMLMNVSQQYEPVTSQLNTARTASPTDIVDEHKQESFVFHDDEQQMQMQISEEPQLGAFLLHNESSFLLVSEAEETESDMEPNSDDSASDDDGNNANEEGEEQEEEEDGDICAQLSSSTLFKQSSRPATAVVIAELPQVGNEISNETPVQSPPTSPGQRSNASYSSFDDHNIQFAGEEPIGDDTFTIHVVADEPVHVHHDHCNGNEINGNDPDSGWKQISDVDRSNVQSVRSVLAQLSDDKKSEDPHTTESQYSQAVGDPAAAAGHDDSDSELFVVQYEHHDFEPPQDVEQVVASEVAAPTENESRRTATVLKTKSGQRDILRLPELDASINTFASKVYDVYSSFDESLMSSVVGT